MATKLSQIPVATFTPGPNATFVGVTLGGQDIRFNLSQITAGVNNLTPTFTAGINGFVPASGGGTQNYLRADGTWNIPPGTGSGGGGLPGGFNGTLQYNNNGVFGGIGLVLGGGLAFNLTNPNSFGLSSQYDSFDITTTFYNYESGEDPGFNNMSGLSVALNANDGQNTNGGLTTAKTTFLPFNVSATYHAAGQKNLFSPSLASYGMGDTSIGQYNVMFAGGPVNGDEGQGLTLTSRFGQMPYGNFNPDGAGLARDTIKSVTQSTIAAGITVTQAITGAGTAQVVTVSSTSGILVGDWLVVGWDAPSGSPNMEAIRVTSIGAGTITAIIKNNQNSGATLNAALVIATFNGAPGFGQQRFIVNESQASITAGTITGVSGGALIGTGTNWTTGMVGGSGFNIGAICAAADYYTGSPFSNTGASGTLNCGGVDSWYLIISVNSTTNLSIFSFSTAAAQNYNGLLGSTSSVNNGSVVASKNYTIRQCARILRMGPDTSGNIKSGVLVCEPSTSTWAINDTLICPVCPYPDVSGRQELTAVWTPGATARFYHSITNHGARAYEGAFLIGSDSSTVSNSDFPCMFQTAISVSNCVTGILINEVNVADIPNNPNSFTSGFGAQSVAIQLGGGGFGGSTGNHRIAWSQGPYMEFNPTNSGLFVQGTNATLQFAAPSSGINADTHLSVMSWRPGASGGGYLELQGITNVAPTYIKLSSPNNTFCQINAYMDSVASPYTSTNGFDFTVSVGGGLFDVFSIQSNGVVFFGQHKIAGTTIGVNMDPNQTTAIRTVTWPDLAGGNMVVNATSNTPASSGAAGTPGSVRQDGTSVYICYDTNKWVKFAGTFSF